jgi:putative ATP-binding cassette transporter
VRRLPLLDLFHREVGPVRPGLIFALTVSGIANAAVLAIINRASLSISAGGSTTREFLAFAVVVALYVVTLRQAFRTTSTLFARIVHRVRVRLVDKIRQTDLITLEHFGRGTLYNTLVQELQIISQSQMGVVAFIQSLLMMVATTFYMLSLSVPGFVIAAVTVLGAAVYYLRKHAFSRDAMERANELGISFVDGVNQVLEGFKEIKMSRARSQAVQADLAAQSRLASEAAVQSASISNDLFLFSQSYFFFVMAIMVFVLPKLVPTQATVITQLTATVLFMVGPLASIVSTIPGLTRANLAAQNILEMEARLDANQPPEGERDQPLRRGYADFSGITMSRVEFSYRDRDGSVLFTIGPIDLAIRRGEILFIVGGNGSGKSSLLKLLTALYFPDAGDLRLDDERITRENAQDYRELFSVIFSDFHLFAKLYGITVTDEAQVEAFLRAMALDTKTRFLGDRFSHTDLSTGQRKRLALLVTYLEDRPIYVFDEWAADQDPEFRRHFYEVMLAELKAHGKTVIAVSHDDRYFHVADRVVKMEYGRIVEELVPPRPARGEGR